MKVSLLMPPATYSDVTLDIEALTSGPRFVRTRGMSRWHRPRSGRRYPDDRVVYDAWCGYGIGGGRKRTFLAAEEPPPGEPVCGTCEGRAAGAGQDDSPTGRPLVFSPRDITPPKNCPASRSSVLFAELPGGRVGRCLACGDMQPLRAMGGPYNPRYAIVQHPTGSALVAPCPFHRWRQLTVRNSRVLCACGRETTS